MGMAMTEKQGGSDVRANTTRALPEGVAGPGKAYRLTGHKWFCSAPMSDGFLMLAQTEKGLSCFLVPRFEPDGSRNKIIIQRLKDKLGNKSNASSEIELEAALAWLVGEEGRGVATIIEMVNHTRLDCILGASALMRQASLQALHHCHSRSAFGKVLSEQYLMMNVLADISLEAEGAARLMMRVAAAYDQANESEEERLFKRIGSAVAKYWVCKRAPLQVAEALECFGGNGYVESGPMPRLFRESPLLGIWEGSGNVICLDVMRSVAKEPETLDAFSAELDRSAGACRRLDEHFRAVKEEIQSMKNAFISKNSVEMENCELTARRFVERLALALEAALIVRQAPAVVADAFLSSRLDREGGFALGTLNSGKAELSQMLARYYPFN
jgi:putative acyl-CoA dehydrogenase